MSWTAEDRRLVLLLRADMGGKRNDGILDARTKSMDWDLFLEKARKNGIAAMSYLKLAGMKRAFSGIPSYVFERLRKDYCLNAAKNTIIFGELSNILNAFKREKLSLIVLKGAALASMVYENLALRPMADVDLLVKKEDFRLADERLKALGYRPNDGSADDMDSSSSYLTSLDYRNSSHNSPSFHLHWHFVNSTVPNESYIHDVNMEHIWRDAEKTEIAGVETLVMAPHHLIIHLSEHGLRVTHSLSKLIFFCDIDKAVNTFRSRLDWNKLAKESIDFHLDRMVYISLHLTSLLMGTEIPGEVLGDLHPRRWSLGEKVFMNAVLNNRSRAGLSYFVHLSMNRGLPGKMKFVWRTFFPPRRILAQKYFCLPKKIGSIHYLRRINEVFFGFFKMQR